MAPLRSTIILAALAGTLAAQTAVKYSYDAAGRLASVVYVNGATISYTYDAAGNLLSRQVTPPTASADEKRQASGKDGASKKKTDEKKTDGNSTEANRQ